MTAAFGSGDVERFRNILARRLGLQFEDAKLAFLGDVLRRRLDGDGRVCENYLGRLEAEAPKDELGALAQELTVAETYFFRNIAQFRAFSEVVLPDRMRAQATRRRLRFLSAGCASGEEAYSLAILLREGIADPSWGVSILGIDVNPVMLEKAVRARFSAWALRETPADAQRCWFHPEGSDMVLDQRVRAAVRFEERNLAEDDPELWQPGTYDVVFCRNVIMYFTQEGSQALLARITRALGPGGYLFLGHAETLRGLSNGFHLRHTHGTFYYQRKEGAEQLAEHLSAGAASPSALVSGPLAALVDGADTWVDAICRAAERIQALAEAPQQRWASGRAAAPVHARRPWDLGLPLELLRRERFAEALDFLRALPPESTINPDVLLLQGVLLTHGGQLTRAEEVCRRLLEVDELNAGAHYVLALCREGSGDRRGAVDHDQVAVYLDPGFAMPRLHLGLLARRAGDRETAHRELGEAVALLQREDPSRLLLFGGGFSRDALVALCRAELLGCGGKP